ncbi:acidic endochitinase-like [Prosopis cineraria]|uniref:acidic endochitinase-like n=1 Tax=Prosopis cineraria TaxID=364024 RepID=UPI00241030B8|nr:acidic endochitinase-like [Prosopis cineraria]
MQYTDGNMTNLVNAWTQWTSMQVMNQTPKLKLGIHCHPDGDTCTVLSSEINASQSQWLLNIFGTTSSRESSDSRPLGNIVLDGVNFDIKTSNGKYWDKLARALKNFDQQLILSVALQCLITP